VPLQQVQQPTRATQAIAQAGLPARVDQVGQVDQVARVVLQQAQRQAVRLEVGVELRRVVALAALGSQVSRAAIGLPGAQLAARAVAIRNR
jgi:hypothetical protein